MSTWKRRAGATVAIAAGIVGIGGVSFAAAPLGSATTDENSATASGIGVPGVVTVNEAHARQGSDDEAPSADYSLLTVADQSVLGKNSDGAWFGLLAALGPVVDSVNGVLCNNNAAYEIPVGDGARVCSQVMPNYIGADDDSAAVGSDAAFVFVEDGSSFYAVQVAPSNADTREGCATASGATAVLHLETLAPFTVLGGEHSETGCGPAA